MSVGEEAAGSGSAMGDASRRPWRTSPKSVNQLIRDARIPLAGVAHQCGTVRFGDDPATSALDVACKAHDLDNLYVVDTSFFPSSSAVNPALTAMANARCASATT